MSPPPSDRLPGETEAAYLQRLRAERLELLAARGELGSSREGWRDRAKAIVLGRPPAAPGPTQAELVSRQAAAVAASGGGLTAQARPDTRTAGAALPSPVQAAARLRVVNPKLWSADIPRDRLRGHAPDLSGCFAKLRACARSRSKGHPQAGNLLAVGGLVLSYVRRNALGFCRLTHDFIARQLGMCSDTVRRSMRFFEARGLLDTFNVTTRDPETGAVWRAANLYIPRVSAEAPAAEPRARLSAQLSRWAYAFGLERRAWGFNRTPAASPTGYAPPPS